MKTIKERLDKEAAKDDLRHVVYIPSKTIKSFQESRQLIRGIAGPVGSGSSVGCIMAIVKAACEQEPDPDGVRRTKVAIIRNTVKELRHTTVRSILEWLPDGKAGEYKTADNIFHFGSSPLKEGKYKHYFRLEDGTYVHCEMIFLGMDRPDQARDLLSLDITMAWLNEFREIPYSIFEATVGRLGRYPKNCTWKGIIMDSNPFSEESIWFDMFINGNDEDIGFWHQPDGMSPEAENIDNLPRNYYQDMIKVAKASGRTNNWINIHVHSQFGEVVDGKGIFSDYFREDIHIAKEVMVPDFEMKVGISFDMGITPAAVFGQLIGQQWHIYHEITSENMGMVQFMEVVMQYISEEYPDNIEFLAYGDPAGSQRSQYDLKTAFQAIRAAGINIQPSIQSPILRREAVIAPLRRENGFLINKDCKMLIRGFLGAYKFRKVKVSEDRYENKPEKNDVSHIHDALGYLCVPFERAGILYNKGSSEFPGAGSGGHKTVIVQDWSLYS